MGTPRTYKAGGRGLASSLVAGAIVLGSPWSAAAPGDAAPGEGTSPPLPPETTEPGPPPPPKRSGQTPLRPWRQTFHESYSYIAIAGVDIDPKLPEGAEAIEGNGSALQLVLRGAKVWRPRDWKVLPWMEAGIDAGTTELTSDPPEDETPLRYAGIAGIFGLDLRIVPWSEQKLYLGAGPLVGGHLEAFTGAESMSYGWSYGGRVRGLWEKRAGKAPDLMGELRVYRLQDKAASATYGELQGAFGVSRTVMLFGFFRARLASSTPDDPDAQVGDRLPFATVFGGGIRTYSDHD